MSSLWNGIPCPSLHPPGEAQGSNSWGPLPKVTLSFGSPVRGISWVPSLEGLVLSPITPEVHRLFLQLTFGGHQAVLSSRLNKSQPVSKYDFRVTICSGCPLKLESHFRAKRLRQPAESTPRHGGAGEPVGGGGVLASSCRTTFSRRSFSPRSGIESLRVWTTDPLPPCIHSHAGHLL